MMKLLFRSTRSDDCLEDTKEGGKDAHNNRRLVCLLLLTSLYLQHPQVGLTVLCSFLGNGVLADNVIIMRL